MRVIYSIGAKFAGGGIGNTAYYAVSGLHSHNLLQRLLCGSFQPTEIPTHLIKSMGLISRGLRKAAIYDRKRRINYWYNALYDRWAARQIQPCGIFHGWGNFCLTSLKKAKELGAITIVERASAHTVLQTRILREEYNRWGHQYHIPQAALERSISEFDVADYVIVPSKFVYNSFIEQGFEPNKLIMLPFGVNLERFSPAPSQKKHPFRLLFVGQISMQKGVIYLLEAWEKLAWHDAELLLVGRVEPDTRAIIQSYRHLSGIRWLGHVSNPEKIYQEANVFVFPSLQEGSALVTYEAMACGLPLITTPNAGSLVRNGQDGFIVSIRNVDQLATAMETLRTNDRQRQQMGLSARARIEPYTWKRYGDSLAATIAEIT